MIKDRFRNWMIARVRLAPGEWGGYGPARRVQRAATAEEQATIEHLTEQQDALGNQIEALPDGEDEQYLTLEGEYDEVVHKLQSIEAQLRTVDPAERDIAGVVVLLDSQGGLDIRRGIVRLEEREARELARIEPSDGASPDNRKVDRPEPETKAKPAHPERLIRQLTAHRTLAIQSVLANRPDKALVVLTHRIAKQVFSERYYREESIAQISVQTVHLNGLADDLDTNPACAELAARREAWLQRLPQGDEAQELFGWLLLQPQEVVMELMAFCVACSINTVASSETASPAAGVVAATLQLDLADYWQPTAAGYLSQITKAQIAAAVAEAVSVEAAVPLASMKKGEAVAAAETLLKGRRWLPAMLRS